MISLPAFNFDIAFLKTIAAITGPQPLSNRSAANPPDMSNPVKSSINPFLRGVMLLDCTASIPLSITGLTPTTRAIVLTSRVFVETFCTPLRNLRPADLALRNRGARRRRFATVTALRLESLLLTRCLIPLALRKTPDRARLAKRALAANCFLETTFHIPWVSSLLETA